MGFRDFQIFNQALLAKQAWRLIEFPDSLCAKLMKAKYYPNGDLLDTAFPLQSSSTWKAIMHGLDLLKKGVIWRVADGTKIKIWRHHWLPRAWFLSTIGSKRPCRLKWVSQLIRDGSREWNEEILERFFHRNDIDEILKIKLPGGNYEDAVAWHYEKTGCFSVRSAYRLSMDWKEIGTTTSPSSNTNGERMVWKKLWALQLPPKVKVFAWKLAHNGLATQSNKVAHRMAKQSTCLICGREEDGHHAVLMCPHARTLHSAMRKFWKLPSEDKLSFAGYEWLLRLIDNNEAEIMGHLILIL